MSFLLFVLGLTILAFAGDYLVNGAVAVAQKLNVPTLIIGLTIVAVGTSLPELVVSLEAALLGQPAVALGNVVGSNISNSTLILGLPALLSPFVVNDKMSKRSTLILIALTFIFMFLLWDGQLSSIDGILLLIGLVLYIGFSIYFAKTTGADIPEMDEISENHASLPMAMIFIIGGIIGLVVGGKWTVQGALGIAEMFNLSAGAVGVTIVALGTSLPELAAGLAAARKNQAGLAIGNIVGSNMVNIVGIMGATAAIAPLSVSARVLNWDIWVMLASTLMFAAILYVSKRVSRPMGIFLSLAYIAFMIEALGFGVAP